MKGSPAICIFLAACSNGAPRWATDSFVLSPNGEQVTGTQTWKLYTKAWQRAQGEEHLVCTAVFDLELLPSPSNCPSCEVAFEVWPVLADSTCASLDDPTFIATRRVGIGTSAGRNASYVDVGSDWTTHGWATAAEAERWDGEAVFELEPVFAWDLSTTSLSRIGAVAPPVSP